MPSAKHTRVTVRMMVVDAANIAAPVYYQRGAEQALPMVSSGAYPTSGGLSTAASDTRAGGGAGPWRLAAGLAVALDLAAIGAVALAIRWLGLTRQSLWLDEAYSVFLSAHQLPTIIGFTAGSDAHPPLYYILLHTWMVFFGTTPAAARGLSVVASVGATWALYAVARQIASRRVALLAATMMALSAFQVWYAQEARMYALVTLATLIGLVGLTRALRGAGLWAWVTFSAGMIVAFYLDYSAMYGMVGVVVWFLVVGRKRSGVSLPFLLSVGGIFLAYLPWLPSLVEQIRGVSGLVAWIGGSSGTGVINVLTDFFFNLSNLSQPITGPLGYIAVAISLGATAFALWAPRRQAAYPLLAYWVCGPLALGLLSEFFGHPITIARTMMLVQPELFLLLALAVDALVSRWSRSRAARVRVAVAGLLLLALLAGNVAALTRANTTIVKEDWSGAATYVASREQPGDLILFNAYFTQMPFDYYFHQRPHGEEPLATERGYQLQETLLYSNLAQANQGLTSASELQGYGRVWLIVSHAPSGDAAIPADLAAHYQLISKHELVGVTVLLFQTLA